MLELTPDTRVSQVLTSLGDALGAGEIDRALELFQDDCYWRDLVAFTWNIRTMEGKPAIRAMLEAQLGTVKPADWTPDPAAPA
ncbi:MAG TPA: nuclear transport factor 2 family protein, partial [Rhodopila sp.]|nr:nuclear transport factor 2 family protein [Rhodopila sp.]